MFPGRLVKGKLEKEGRVSCFNRSGMHLIWPFSLSSSCLQGLLLLVGEVTAGEKQWFNPGCFCLGFESGLFASFPLFSAADLLAVHDIPGWLYNFLERVSGQAMLSRSMWTNGGTTECSSYHFMGVDFESMGRITLAWLLQRAKTYITRQKLQTINFYFPVPFLGLKESFSMWDPLFTFVRCPPRLSRYQVLQMLSLRFGPSA
ncbi:hypothetical protein V6N11_005292 [Hibiscus sabdariffa]|uniref:Uncharacterized protein n=2 Tax=Hibiscus sabdariffa TaxID=183260 RepID=A0ABR2RMT6_9ROSI